MFRGWALASFVIPVIAGACSSFTAEPVSADGGIDAASASPDAGAPIAPDCLGWSTKNASFAVNGNACRLCARGAEGPYYAYRTYPTDMPGTYTISARMQGVAPLAPDNTYGVGIVGHHADDEPASPDPRPRSQSYPSLIKETLQADIEILQPETCVDVTDIVLTSP